MNYSLAANWVQCYFDSYSYKVQSVTVDRISQTAAWTSQGWKYLLPVPSWVCKKARNINVCEILPNGNYWPMLTLCPLLSDFWSMKQRLEWYFLPRVHRKRALSPAGLHRSELSSNAYTEFHRWNSSSVFLIVSQTMQCWAEPIQTYLKWNVNLPFLARVFAAPLSLSLSSDCQPYPHPQLLGNHMIWLRLHGHQYLTLPDHFYFMSSMEYNEFPWCSFTFKEGGSLPEEFWNLSSSKCHYDDQGPLPCKTFLLWSLKIVLPNLVM